MRYLLTDLRGNPIYSLSYAGPLEQSSTGCNNHNSDANRIVSSSAGTRHQHRPYGINHNHIYVRYSPYSHHFNRRLSGSSCRGGTATRTSFAASASLFSMVRNRAWDDVIRRATRYPNEVYGKESSTGNTLLHVACRLDPPPKVIEALRENCRIPNAEGATPLHIAASHRCSAAALQALLDVSSKSEHPNDDGDDDDSSYMSKNHSSATADLSRMGRAPIHYACMSFRGLDIDAFRLLLDASLRDGNLWLEKPKLPSTHHEDDLINEEDIEDLDFEECENTDHPLEAIDTIEQYDDKTTCGNIVDNTFQSFRDIEGCLTMDNSIISASCNDRVLVNVMGLKDATGQTPLALLFRRYRERVRCVINTLDCLRAEHGDDPVRLAFHAAITVHNDLGQLWDKARWIIARLTEERLAKDNNSLKDTDCLSLSQYKSDHKHRIGAPGLESPGDVAVAQEAAQWATEQQYCSKFMSSSLHANENASTSESTNLEETITLPADDAISVSKMTVVSTHSTMQNVGVPAANIRQFRIVHASVGLIGYGCPPELIRLAISIYPHQVSEMDEDGNLPLHIAVTAESVLSPPSAAFDFGLGLNTSASDDHSVISDAAMSFFSSATVSQASNPFAKVIKMLIQQYPIAAQIPHGRYGQLPLVMAVESGRRTWEDGIRTLLNAYPPALHNKKLIESSLYPNLLALLTNGEPEKHDKNLLYGASDVGSIIDVVPSFRAASSRIAPRSGKTSSKQQKHARHVACARTTLFELLRTKPELLCKGFGF
jgi:ankyrin repeat protein